MERGTWNREGYDDSGTLELMSNRLGKKLLGL